MEAHIGVNRRIFQTNFVDTDDQHVTKPQHNERAYLVNDGLTGANTLLEHNLLDNIYPRTREEIFQYEIREPNSLGKKPAVVQELVDELIPVGLYEIRKGLFPYNLNELQQRQYENSLNESINQQVLLNGKMYSTGNIVNELIAKVKSEPE